MNARLEVLSRYRWTICALLFAGISINYMDRQTISLLKPTLQQLFGWSEIDYGNIVFAFTLAYGFGAIFAGRLIDMLGTRRGFSVAVTIWSIAAAAHALASSVGGFIASRFALGAGESGAFPASIKAVAESFPLRERALATGIFNAGTSIGAVATPLFLPLLVLRVGWRWSFVITAAFGLIWLALWLKLYREAAASANSPSRPARWSQVFPHRQTWAFAAGKFLTDPIWFLYLFWLPDFLQRTHGLNLKGFGLPLAAIYLLADIGSVAGGWLSSTLIARGWSRNKARKVAMLACALCVMPMAFTPLVTNLWVAVLIIGIAAGAHQGFSANLFTLPSDTFEERQVAAVTGIGSTSGAIGGMLIALVVAQILQRTGSYMLVFLIPCGAYVLALATIHALSPGLERVGVGSGTTTGEPAAA